MYIVRNIHKFSEEDTYNGGCLPNTGINMVINLEFTAGTTHDMKRQLIAYFTWDNDENAWYENAEEDFETLGRFDIQVMETKNGIPATKENIEAWKLGHMKLWSAMYTGILEHVTPATWKEA